MPYYYLNLRADGPKFHANAVSHAHVVLERESTFSAALFFENTQIQATNHEDSVLDTDKSECKAESECRLGVLCLSHWRCHGEKPSCWGGRPSGGICHSNREPDERTPCVFSIRRLHINLHELAFSLFSHPIIHSCSISSPFFSSKGRRPSRSIFVFSSKRI